MQKTKSAAMQASVTYSTKLSYPARLLWFKLKRLNEKLPGCKESAVKKYFAEKFDEPVQIVQLWVDELLTHGFAKIESKTLTATLPKAYK